MFLQLVRVHPSLLLLRTDKNGAIYEQQKMVKDTNLPPVEGVVCHNVKWARGTKDGAGQPGNKQIVYYEIGQHAKSHNF